MCLRYINKPDNIILTNVKNVFSINANYSVHFQITASTSAVDDEMIY